MKETGRREKVISAGIQGIHTVLMLKDSVVPELEGYISKLKKSVFDLFA